ncbi:MAG: hypothetical protein ACRC0L_11955 [Angustibacter sp.]
MNSAAARQAPMTEGNAYDMHLRHLASPRVPTGLREREAERHRLDHYLIRLARARRAQRRAERRMIEAGRRIRSASG